MKKRYLIVFALIALIASQALGYGPASAFTTIVDGAIDPATDPTMPVVFISPPNCTGQGASPVHYTVVEIPADQVVEGTYTFSVTSEGGYASIYLFQDEFDPAAAFGPNCVAADNSGNPVVITFDLVADTDYFLVIFDDTFAQLGGPWQLVQQSPGPPPTSSTTTTSTTAPPATTPSTTPVTAPVAVTPVAAAQRATPAFTG